ncbi:DUF1715-domain-containing protein [Cystobasidium minutum MCA 4210]|uniref:DUF1715-domain-containing protein n=1 Tax=Cystobasidium minutum MCA 4210 TaxID=1397322 RepID=UPI0034CD2EFD|eukprot:jgi/Rhomi1/194546/gm1.2760_g
MEHAQPTAVTHDADDIEDLNKLEAAFYTSGYEAGFEHGKAHGVFEGRALGQEKGFEVFEELYYYAGQARFWQAIAREDAKKQKALPHIISILKMIESFPTHNSTDESGKEFDPEALIQSIRSKYRIMCASLAIRPRIQKAEMSM